MIYNLMYNMILYFVDRIAAEQSKVAQIMSYQLLSILNISDIDPAFESKTPERGFPGSHYFFVLFIKTEL